MFLIETNTIDVFKKQYFYKLKAYMGFFVSLVSVQILSLLFSFNGTMNMGTSDGFFSLTSKVYSSELIIIFTMIWAFIVAITLTTKPYRNYDFTFVSNRLTSSLSNISFILTVSIVGSITAILTGIVLRVIIYFSTNMANISPENFIISAPELFISIFVTFLYISLLCASGYFVGTVVQLFKPLVVLLPALIIALLILEARTFGSIRAFTFFVKEGSLLFFTAKVLLTATILFGSAALLQSKLEVRR